ncbi:S8 family serine peptidase [candidate division WWE3 bacterium]|uniref:S8 family serine peptidase n=1 Tax=candidate division WWE3 bacterium TaxID=2053526 RepID=A0A955LL36_UNCKA|nr:S8 family serine peptidase [candidate division WWE3 bacterium]
MGKVLSVKSRFDKFVYIVSAVVLVSLGSFLFFSKYTQAENRSENAKKVGVVVEIRSNAGLSDEQITSLLSHELIKGETIEDTFDLVNSTKEQTEINKEKFPERAQRIPEDAIAPDLNLVKTLKVYEDRAVRVVESLNSNPFVESVEMEKDPELLPEVPLSAEPNDVIYGSGRRTWEGFYENPPDNQYLTNIGLNPTNDGDSDSGWDVTTGSNTVVVGVYGTVGFDYTHPDLEDNVWINPGEFPESSFPGLDANSDGILTVSELRDWSVHPLLDFNGDNRINLKDLFVEDPQNYYLNEFDDDYNGYLDDFIGNAGSLWDDGSVAYGHETSIAGVIGASGNNAKGQAGINWNVRLMLLSGGTSYAITYAVDNGADVVNISYAGQGIGQSAAVDYAWANGTIVVYAAGNSNALIPYSSTRSEHTILVGGLLFDNTKASWSDYGARLDFAATGYGMLMPTSDWLQSPYIASFAGTPKGKLVSDIDGDPAFVYYDWENDSLFLARDYGSGWTYETVSQGDYIGLYASLAFDSTNTPHISAYDYDDRKLVHLTYNGLSWDVTEVTSADDQGQYTSIMIASDDTPRIAFVDKTNATVRYASYDGGWTLEDIDDIGAFDESLFKQHVSLKLAADDTPMVAYYDIGSGDLMYATKPSSTWDITTVDSSGDVGAYLDMDLDSNDYPRVVYSNVDFWDVKLATYDGSTWSTENVLTTGDVGKFDNHLAIKSDDSVVITTADETKKLHSLTYNGSSWDDEVFGTSEYLGAIHTMDLIGDEPEVIAFSWHRGMYDARYSSGWTVEYLRDFGTNYKYSNGTSFAAPVIVGSAALLISAHPDWSIDEIYWLLASTATHYGSGGTWHDTSRGWGVPNLKAALDVSDPLVDDTFPTASISSPADGSTVAKGVVAVTGSASDDNFTYYDLLYKRHTTSTWSAINHSVRLPVTDDVLGSWNASGLEDGDYDLRLVVHDWYQSTTVDYVITVGVGEPTPTPTLIPTPTIAFTENEFGKTSGSFAPNGAVYSIISNGDDVYIGGDFSYLGTYTGIGTYVNSQTGALSEFPVIDSGVVYASVADGTGGILVGGSFSKSGDIDLNNIVHVLSDGTIDTNFKPNVSGAVKSIAISGNDVYIGGSFTSVNGVTRNRMAKLSLVDGGLDSTFNPNANQTVNTIAVASDGLYVGGVFTTLGGEDRDYFAKINKNDGSVISAFNLGFNGEVKDLLLSGTSLYAGGAFSIVGGYGRSNLVKIDTTNATVDLTFLSQPNSTVLSIVKSGTSLYVSGYFTNIGGYAKSYLGKINANTGTLDLSFSAEVNGVVYKTKYSNEKLFISGGFTELNGEENYTLGKVSALTGETDSGFDASAGPSAYSIEIVGGDLFVGGSFKSVNGYVRNRVAKINNTTGLVDPDFKVAVNSVVNSMALFGNNLYIGGTFSVVDGNSIGKVAKIDATTGAVDAAFNPNPSIVVYSLAADQDNLYVGGFIISIGGQSISHVAKVDASSGVVDTGFSLSPNNIVNSLLLDGNSLYIGGPFSNIGGESLNGIVKVDKSSGVVDTDFNANVDGTISKMLVDGADLYLAGGFTTVGGVARNSVAKVDKSTGALKSFDPDSNNWVYALAKDDEHVYLGGSFTQMGGETFLRFAAVGVTTIMANDKYTFVIPYDVSAIELVGDDKYVGGGFSSVNGEDRYGYLFKITEDVEAPDISLTPLSPDPTTDKTPTFEGEATDAIGLVTSVSYQIDSNSGSWKSCSANDSSFDEENESFECNVPTALSLGSHTIYVRATDSNGNTTLLGNEVTDVFTVYTPTPTPTATPTPTPTTVPGSTVTPTSAHVAPPTIIKLLSMGNLTMIDGVYVYYYTTGNDLTFSGITSPNATVVLTIYSDPYRCTTQADGEGYWECSFAEDIPNGYHRLTIDAYYDGSTSISTQEYTLGIGVGLAQTGDPAAGIMLLGVFMLSIAASLYPLRKMMSMRE